MEFNKTFPWIFQNIVLSVLFSLHCEHWEGENLMLIQGYSKYKCISRLFAYHYSYKLLFSSYWEF